MSKKDSHTLGEALVSITARFPTSLAAQIDAHLAAMRRTIPGITLARSDALRSLVLHALEALYGPSAGGAPDIITDTSTRRLLQKEKRRAREGGVTDTVTDTSGIDPAHVRRMIQEEMRTVMAQAENIIDAIDKAEHATGTAPDTVTDTVTDTAAAPPVKRKAPSRQRVVPYTVTDTVSDTAPALEPFDTIKYRLGKLCPRHHDYHGSGQSLRMNNKSGGCRACDVEQKRERRHATRQPAPAD